MTTRSYFIHATKGSPSCNLPSSWEAWILSREFLWIFTSLKITVNWNMTPCSLANGYRRFRKPASFSVQKNEPNVEKSCRCLWGGGVVWKWEGCEKKTNRRRNILDTNKINSRLFFTCSSRTSVPFLLRPVHLFCIICIPVHPVACRPVATYDLVNNACC